jgi:hypothetical protein
VAPAVGRGREAEGRGVAFNVILALLSRDLRQSPGCSPRYSRVATHDHGRAASAEDI